MLWQAAYAEFYFTDTLWPDFGPEEFTETLMMYTNRDRRFGNAADKIADSPVINTNSEERDEHA